MNMTSEECQQAAEMLDRKDKSLCSLPEKKMQAIMCYSRLLQKRDGMEAGPAMKEAWRKFKDVCEVKDESR